MSTSFRIAHIATTKEVLKEENIHKILKDGDRDNIDFTKVKYGFETPEKMDELVCQWKEVGGRVDKICSEDPEKVQLHITTETNQTHGERNEAMKKYLATNKFGDIEFSGEPATICYYMAKDSKTTLSTEFGEHVMFRGPMGEPYGTVWVGEKTEKERPGQALFGPLADDTKTEEPIPVSIGLKGKSKVFGIVAVLHHAGCWKQQIFPRHEKSLHKQFSYISLATPENKNIKEFAELVGCQILINVGEEHTATTAKSVSSKSVSVAE